MPASNFANLFENIDLRFSVFNNPKMRKTFTPP